MINTIRSPLRQTKGQKMKFVITRYLITGCWYGKKRSGTPVNSFELNAILDGFNTWVNAATHITQTRISGTEPFKVYVKDSHADGTDYAVCLWLSSADSNENVYTIRGDDPPNGDQCAEVISFDEGMIPGTPTFFFVDAAHNALYTMRPEKIRINGKPQFDAALRFFMARRGSTIPRRLRVDNDGVDVIELNMVGPDGETLKPKFESELQKNPTVAEEILRRYKDIRKIIHVQDISKKTVDEKRSTIRRLCEILDADVSDDNVMESKRIKCEIDVHLTRDEVEKLIQRQGEAGSGEKVAFKFKGDAKQVWADQCIARKVVDLSIDADGPHDITARKLLEAIRQNRSIVIE